MPTPLKIRLYQAPGGEMTVPANNDLLLVERASDHVAQYIKYSTLLTLFTGAGGTYSDAQARACVLTGLNTSSGAVITASDSVLSAFGKLEARMALNDAKATYTDAAVRACALTGLSTASGGAVTAADSILVAIGRLENRVALNDAKAGYTDALVRACVLTGLSTGSGGAVTASDTVLQAFGKLENRTALNDAKITYADASVRACLLTGLSTATGGAVTATDSILIAFGRHENRMVINDAKVGHTDALVRACVLTGLSTASGGSVTASDSILVAIGRLENRSALNDAKVTYADASVRACVLTGLSTASSATVVATDSILVAIGKLENRMATNDAKASTPNAVVNNDTNNVEETLFVISDGGGTYNWHINVNDGFDGASNPYLISTIGRAETLTSKTLTAPTLNAGVLNGIFTGAPNFAGAVLFDVGPTFTTSPTFTAGILSPAIKGFPTIIVDSFGGAGTGIIQVTFPGGGLSSANEETMLIQNAPIISGARKWNFGRWLDGSQILSFDGETVMRIGDSDALTRACLLTGLSTATGGAVTASDSVLIAMGRLQNRMATNDAKVTYADASVRACVLTGLSTASTAAVTASDSILVAIGRHEARMVINDAKTGYTDALVRACVLTGIDVSTTGSVASTDTILSALGKLQATKLALGSLSATAPITYSAGVIACNAASANTASYLVQRDSSGNFSAGTITAALAGNASTATGLATARAINGTNFDGTAAITVTAAAGTLTGATLAANVTASSLISVGTLTTLTTAGLLTVTQATANAGILAATGYSLTGSNATSMIDLAGTWNTSGTPTALKLNLTDTASNVSSLLMDLQIGGVSKFTVDKTGIMTLAAGDIKAPGQITFYRNGAAIAEIRSGGFQVGTNYIGFSSNIGSGSADVQLNRDAAAVLSLRNSTNAQTFRVYGTYTDASNFNRIEFKHLGGTSGGVVQVSALGTGGVGPLQFALSLTAAAPTNIFNLATSGHLLWNTTNAYDIGGGVGTTSPRFIYADTQVYAATVRTSQTTVASLPSASTSGAGARAFVTDANTTVILGLGGTVTGGGSNKVPVYSDGTNWIIG